MEYTIMHPAMFAWWNHVRRGHGGGCGPHQGGPHGGREEHASAFPDWDGSEGGGGGSFGVRRPLRFLAHKLDLSQKQVDELAKVLSDLKTERAQVAVDQRRTTTAFADAIADETFDASRVEAVATERVKSQERLRDALVSALKRIHALLTPEQRSRLAYLLRTGALMI
ncbi:MAG: Spy/CpxP family protein refolding chaperone [Polyangiaceae bacterium]|nr:Spy/CpxP family protein refolding chaperone [Polyangiaceae bacterium]